jgi:hypothetical protein
MALRNLVAQTGLSMDRELVTYGVVAGAGDVAIVPLLSSGSGGTMAVAVVGIGRDGPQVLALLTPDSSARGRIRVAVEGGQLVSSIAVLGPEDALCCPSQTKRIYYGWDGTRLRMEREVTSQNAPSAKE